VKSASLAMPVLYQILTDLESTEQNAIRSRRVDGDGARPAIGQCWTVNLKPPANSECYPRNSLPPQLIGSMHLADHTPDIAYHGQSAS